MTNELILIFFNYGCFLGKGSPKSSDEKDQEIIVVSPLPEENIGQTSGSTPILPYSHGQADFSSLTPPSSSIPISSLPMPISQNVTIKHFPLSSFSSNFPYHSSFQSSSTSLPVPLLILILFYFPPLVPPYKVTLFLLSILRLPLYLALILWLGLPFLFSSQLFSPNLFSAHGLFLTLFIILNLYMLLPAIPLVPFHSLPSQPFVLILLPPFPILFLFFQPYPTLLGQAPVVLPGEPLDVGKEAGVEVTSITPPEDLILKHLTLTPLLSALWTFLPQTFLGLVFPGILVLMVP